MRKIPERWRALAPEQRQAAAAAAALGLGMFLPWYSLTSPTASKHASAFSVFSFVEAAVLLVAAAILYLLWARADGRAFHLPGGDGWAITAVGSSMGRVWALPPVGRSSSAREARGSPPPRSRVWMP